MTTTLYRHYDSTDQLLYVGITNNVQARFRTHRSTTWWPSVTRFTLQDFPDRTSAAAAERKAIATERPLHNVAGGPAAYPGSVIPAPTGARRILVTGSRDFVDRAVIEAAILAEGPGTVIHGCGEGAEQLAHEVATRYRIRGYTVEPHPAKWSVLGGEAELVRDAEVVSLGADICLAFLAGGGKGMVDLATMAGIPVKEFRY